MTFRHIVPSEASKRLHGFHSNAPDGPYARLLRAWTIWRLRREGEKTMRSFLAVSEALGLPLFSPKQTPEQLKRLARVHEIRNTLMKLKFPQT